MNCRCRDGMRPYKISLKSSSRDTGLACTQECQSVWTITSQVVKLGRKWVCWFETSSFATLTCILTRQTWYIQYQIDCVKSFAITSAEPSRHTFHNYDKWQSLIDDFMLVIEFSNWRLADQHYSWDFILHRCLGFYLILYDSIQNQSIFECYCFRICRLNHLIQIMFWYNILLMCLLIICTL